MSCQRTVRAVISAHRYAEQSAGPFLISAYKHLRNVRHRSIDGTYDALFLLVHRKIKHGAGLEFFVL